MFLSGWLRIMNVKVKFLGIFREAYGCDSATVKVEGSMRLRDLLRLLTDYSPRLREVLIDPVSLTPNPNALILINGREINVLDGIDTRIKDGDEIVLIPVTHGG